jgi:hypothetical protein
MMMFEETENVLRLHVRFELENSGVSMTLNNLGLVPFTMFRPSASPQLKSSQPNLPKTTIYLFFFLCLSPVSPQVFGWLHRTCHKMKEIEQQMNLITTK